MSEGRAILCRDLYRLEEWTSKNSKKFNKDECTVLHLGQQNQKTQHKLGCGWGAALLKGT